MSQSVSFYLVDHSQFETLKANLRKLSSILPTADVFTLGGTQMGLQYLLKKLRPSDGERIDTIVEPQIFPSWHDALGMDPVYYFDRPSVEYMHQVLNTVEPPMIADLYNAAELNAAHVYPVCWTDREGSAVAFNKEHLRIDYEQLRQAFREARASGRTIICFVG